MGPPADGTIAVAQATGEFAGALLLAFLVSRLGLYIRRSSRHEPSTVVGVHLISFFILGLVACSSRNVVASPGLTFFFAQLTMGLIDYFTLPDPTLYHDDRPQRPAEIKPLRYVLIGGAILLGVGLPILADRPASDEEIVAGFEARLKSDAVLRTYFDALKRNFPKEYEGALADLTRRTRQADTGAGQDPYVLRKFEEDFIARIDSLIEKHRAAMAQAPAPALNAYARAWRDFILEAEKHAPRHCAAYTLTSLTRAQARSMPPAMELPVARIAAAMLDAARAGLARPARRDLDERPTGELERLDALARAKLEPSLREALGDRRAVGMLPTPDRCRIAVAYVSAIAELPSETSAAITAFNLGGPEA